MNSDDNIFDFLSEISKENTYHLLFPDSKAGMAIIWLYEKMEHGLFPGKIFRESDIHEALQFVNVTGELNNTRHPKEQYNAIIGELQEYFIRYDEELQQYSFKEYALTFCRRAKETLKAFFDPTQIEKICYSLREKLNNATSEELLINWFHTEFAIFKPHLKSQLDYLDKQIDQSVLTFRENKRLNLQEGAIIETLRLIDERFEIIRSQNKELRTAFREIDQIRKLIDKYTAEFDNEYIHNYAHDAITFFQEMRKILSLIDKRLDRIQPRIKQLFSNLNKPLFNSRIEKFLSYILKDSFEQTLDNKKVLLFPNNIPLTVLYGDLLNFTIVERKNDLFPAKPHQRLRFPENAGLKEKAFNATVKQVLQQDKVAIWIDTIQKELDANKRVDLSSYFFRIFRENNDDQSFALAVVVIYRALKHFEQLYNVAINPENLVNDSYKKTMLWQMIVTPR